MRLGRISTIDGGTQVVSVTARGAQPLLVPHPVASLDVRAFDYTSSPRLGEPVADPVWTFPSLPGKIVAIGLNYRLHADESGAQAPSAPLVFAKFPSSLIGPDEAIEIDPELSQRVDWEVELGVVIGRRMRYVEPADALDYVFGYTVANDISGRDAQFGDGQWTRGKSFDTFCPVGPVIVTADEISDPHGPAAAAAGERGDASG